MHFIGILLEDNGFELREVLLPLESLDTLLLVLSDAAHLLPDFFLLGRELGLLPLLIKLREVLVDTLIE